LLENISWLLSHTKILVVRGPCSTISAVQSTLAQPRFTQGTCANHTRGASGAPGDGHSLSPPQIAWPYTSLCWPKKECLSNPRSSCTPPLFSRYRKGGKQGSEFRVSSCLQVGEGREMQQSDPAPTAGVSAHSKGAVLLHTCQSMQGAKWELVLTFLCI